MALLSILMLPHLIKSTTPTDASRLVIVSSDAHFFVDKIKGATNWPSILEKLNDERYCAGLDSYKFSKLLGVMFVRELASRLPNPTPVSVSAINPGFCDSHITRSVESNAVIKVMVRMMKALLARTTEMGSRTLVHPAVESGERARHGRFVSSCEVTEESDYVLSDEGKEISRRVWTETVEVLGKIDPRVNHIISEHLLAR
ncbi:hypothetical protein OG21DRAFT_1482117 [Imleria badia]|nr:hypothetical protein OG21DRAFT_1482117 [Imleria badia]